MVFGLIQGIVLGYATHQSMHRFSILYNLVIREAQIQRICIGLSRDVVPRAIFIH